MVDNTRRFVTWFAQVAGRMFRSCIRLLNYVIYALLLSFANFHVIDHM